MNMIIKVRKVGYIILSMMTVVFILFIIFINPPASISSHKLLTLNGQIVQIPAPKKELTWVNFWSITCPTLSTRNACIRSDVSKI